MHPIWDPTTFTKNRDRLQNGEAFAKFMTKPLNHPQVKRLLSEEHFSVDGTLIEAWASHKSFLPKDGSGGEDGGANFHGPECDQNLKCSALFFMLGRISDVEAIGNNGSHWI